MKKLLLLAVAALMTFTMSAQSPKIAHVNFAELVQLMPESDTARDQMEAANKEAQETYQSMYMEFSTKYQQYQEKVNTWTPAIKESKEKELADMQNRLQEFNNSIQQELQAQEAKLMAPIQQKAIDAVKKLAKDGGIAYVFDVSSVLYFDEKNTIDLTPAARKALNIPADRTLESLHAELQAKQQAAIQAAQAAQAGAAK